MKKILNRMSDTTVYRYATGFVLAVMSALKSTLIWVLERGSFFLGITAIIAVVAIDEPVYRFIVLLVYMLLAPLYLLLKARRKN